MGIPRSPPFKMQGLIFLSSTRLFFILFHTKLWTATSFNIHMAPGHVIFSSFESEPEPLDCMERKSLQVPEKDLCGFSLVRKMCHLSWTKIDCCLYLTTICIYKSTRCWITSLYSPELDPETQPWKKPSHVCVNTLCVMSANTTWNSTLKILVSKVCNR